MKFPEYNRPYDGKVVGAQTYTRPVEAKLTLTLANEEQWEATETDLQNFGYVHQYAVMRLTQHHLRKALYAGADRPTEAINAAVKGVYALVDGIALGSITAETVVENEDLARLGRLIERALAAGINGDPTPPA